MRLAASTFGDIARVLEPVDVNVDTRVNDELIDAVLSVVSRHPLQEVEIVRMLSRWAPARAQETLAALSDSGKIKVIERYGKLFWCAADTRFPDQREAGTKRPDRPTRQMTPSPSP